MSKHKVPFVVALAKLFLPTYYRWLYRWEVQGIENIPMEGAVIIASNHVTARDPLFLGCICKRLIHYMAKDSLFQNKFMNALLRHAGAFPVARGSGGTEALAEAYKLLEEGHAVGVFIEGTRSKTGELLRPKTGISLLAYRTHAPVLPVCLIAEGGTCPEKRKKRMIIKIGKLIPFEDLEIPEEASMHFRRAAKRIMEHISALRDESIAHLAKKE